MVVNDDDCDYVMMISDDDCDCGDDADVVVRGGDGVFALVFASVQNKQHQEQHHQHQQHTKHQQHRITITKPNNTTTQPASSTLSGRPLTLSCCSRSTRRRSSRSRGPRTTGERMGWDHILLSIIGRVGLLKEGGR